MKLTKMVNSHSARAAISSGAHYIFFTNFVYTHSPLYFIYCHLIVEKRSCLFKKKSCLCWLHFCYIGMIITTQRGNRKV
jgi:hypothetical protein